MKFSISAAVPGLVAVATASIGSGVVHAKEAGGGIRGKAVPFEDGGVNHEEGWLVPFDNGGAEWEGGRQPWEEDGGEGGGMMLPDMMSWMDGLREPGQDGEDRPPSWAERQEFASRYLEELHGPCDYDHEGYFQRMLDENGDFRPPDATELADLLLMEVDHQRSVNGTADPDNAMARVAEKILAKAGNITNSNDTEWLTKQLVLPHENSTELLVLEDAVLDASNNSKCEIPGKCMSLSRTVQVKNFIRTILNENILTNTLPDVNLIYKRLQDELGVSAESADKLIESSPRIRKYLKSKIKKAERVVRKKELSPLAREVEKTLVDAGHNMTDFDAALNDLDLDEDEVTVVLRAMGTTRSDKVKEALKKPAQDLAKQVDEAYAEQEAKGDNHTHFRELDELDENGQRKLQFIPHPNSMGIEDHMKDIDDRLRRRRLARRRRLPEDTTDFENRLFDHIDELQGHIRELKIACDVGTTSTRCVADKLDEVSRVLTVTGAHIKEQTEPLSDLLGKMSTSQKTLDSVERTANIVFTAIKMAAQIPQIGPTVFKVVEIGMTPVHKVLGSVDKKATQFENSVGKVWKNSIGRVEQVISSFDSGAVFYVVSGATMVAAIQESQCMSSLINHLAGANVIIGIEQAVDLVKTYVESLLDALFALGSHLLSRNWGSIQNTFSALVGAVEPIRMFFAPFEKLSTLLTEKIEIRPWLKPPRKQRQFGPNRCEDGFRKDLVNLKKCWEKDTWDWEWSPLSIPAKMRLTCQRESMGTHWTGNCQNYNYGRSHCGKHVDCWCTCRWFCCPRCETRCNWGGHNHVWWNPFTCYAGCDWRYTEIFDNCWRSNCPWGYGTSWDKVLCTKDHWRWQQSLDTNCDQYNHLKHWSTNYFQDIFGQCWETCRPGEDLIFGQCFPTAVLSISIQDIVDAFNQILNFIKGLPVVKQITDAIDFLVRSVLQSVIDKIADWIKGALNLPDFPDIDASFLPFDAFDEISLQMPEAPDMKALADLPMQKYNELMNQLPAPISGIGNCGTDMSCIAAQLGLGDPSDLMDPITDVLGHLKGVRSSFMEMLKGIKCNQWSVKTLPCSDAMAALGFPDINECDIGATGRLGRLSLGASRLLLGVSQPVLSFLPSILYLK